MSWLGGLVVLAVSGWGLAVLALVLFQRPLIYRPDEAAATPSEAGTPWLREVRQDGRLLGWWVPPRTSEGLVLAVFYGNRGTLARMAAKTAAWHHWGFGLFLVAYRGYDGNPGKPSEAGLEQDGRAALDWLAGQGFPADRLVLYGESLGASPALRLASGQGGRALILEAPFSSLIELAAERHPWAPVRWLLRHRHDNRPHIAGLSLPILILHGDADRTTPVEHSRRLAALAGPNCRLAVIPGAGHLDLHDKGATPVMTAFLSGV